MPYDSALDQQLFSKSIETQAGGKITVSVHSYNNGAKKLQIIRANTDEEGNARFAKLGRLTKEEAQNVLPIMQEALGHMD